MSNWFVRALVSLLIFGVVSAIAEAICRHFTIDPFWGWLVGVAAGLAFFFGYDRKDPHSPVL
jgi:steroid 5-alpha reductase family enzyme